MSKPNLLPVVPKIIGETSCKFGPSNNQLFHFKNILFERPFYNSREPNIKSGVKYLTRKRIGPELVKYYVDPDVRLDFLAAQRYMKNIGHIKSFEEKLKDYPWNCFKKPKPARKIALTSKKKSKA
ncbi:uncharacterized protein LOC135146640 [Zophobas morio]|uniref:uncharacterized protein LOC135146640 n=1 Tax=Zophobas morio TaxID=2755281 RepID=UPI003083E15A